MKGTILYIGNFELPDKGAAANRVVSNGKLFNKLGYRVAFLGVKKGKSFKGFQPCRNEAHMYEEAYPIGTKEWFIHMCSVKKIKSLADLYDDICMIILYNVPFVLLKNVKSAFKNTGIKVVYDCTEWTGVTDGSFIKRFVKRLDEYFIKNKIANVADGLIVISKRMEKAYEKCRNLILLPPLVDINDSIWHQENVKETVAFEFCFAGILDGNKDSLDRIIEAFSILDEENSILRIIGVTEDEFCKYYPESEKFLSNNKDRIKFMGFISHKESIKYVLGSDCYIFIRQSDTRNNAGFPTKFAEAYTCGVPIITTNISDIKDYEKEDIQLLDGMSSDEISKAMLIAMKSKIKENQLNMCFHYESYAEKCREWIEELLR